MGLSCGASVVKYGIFIFNLLCAVSALLFFWNKGVEKIYGDKLQLKIDATSLL